MRAGRQPPDTPVEGYSRQSTPTRRKASSLSRCVSSGSSTAMTSERGTTIRRDRRSIARIRPVAARSTGTGRRIGLGMDAMIGAIAGCSTFRRAVGVSTYPK